MLRSRRGKKDSTSVQIVEDGSSDDAEEEEVAACPPLLLDDEPEEAQPHRRAALAPMRIVVHPPVSDDEARDMEYDEDGNLFTVEDDASFAAAFTALVETFPSINPDFLRRVLRSASENIERAAAWITEQPDAEIPKRPLENAAQPPMPEEEDVVAELNLEPGRPVLRFFDSWKDFKQTDFYSDKFWDNLNLANVTENGKPSYKKEAEWRLSHDFPWIRQGDLLSVFKRFQYRFALTHRIINDGIQQVLTLRGMDKMKQLAKSPIDIDVLKLPGHVGPMSEEKLRLQVLDEPRRTTTNGEPNVYDYTNEPPNLFLAKEVEWMKQIEEQEEQLRKASPDELIECVICATVFILDEVRSCEDGHQFCRDCVETYADETIFGMGKGSLTCMVGNCDKEFSRAVLNSTLRPKCIERMLEADAEKNIRDAGIKGLHQCKGCGFTVQIEQSPKEWRVYTCPKQTCRKSWCRMCGMPWNKDHFGKTCADLNENLPDIEKHKMEEMATDIITRTCGACNSAILKIEGCNEMTCTCGNKFCYLCEKQQIDYDHFCRHARDPGQLKCNQCDLPCLLFEDAERRDEEMLRELERENEARMAKLEADRKEAAETLRRNQEAVEDGANAGQANGEAANKENEEKQPEA